MTKFGYGDGRKEGRRRICVRGGRRRVTGWRRFSMRDGR